MSIPAEMQSQKVCVLYPNYISVLNDKLNKIQVLLKLIQTVFLYLTFSLLHYESQPLNFSEQSLYRHTFTPTILATLQVQ